MHTHAFRLALDESVEQFKDNLPWAMIALAIVVSTCIVVFLIFYCGECCWECCCGGRHKSKAFRDHLRRSTSWKQSLWRVFVLIFAALIGAGGFWIAATTFGVSFWNIIFSYGIAALLIGQVFGFALQNLGAYIQVVFTGKVINDIYVKFLRTPMEGRITNMNISWFELEYVKDGKVMFFYVPTREFVASPFVVIEEYSTAPIRFKIK